MAKSEERTFITNITDMKRHSVSRLGNVSYMVGTDHGIFKTKTNGHVGLTGTAFMPMRRGDKVRCKVKIKKIRNQWEIIDMDVP